MNGQESLGSCFYVEIILFGWCDAAVAATQLSSGHFMAQM